MDHVNVAPTLAAVIAQEIQAQLGVHRRTEEISPLNADAVPDEFNVQLRDRVAG